jgi:hypothetical protein
MFPPMKYLFGTKANGSRPFWDLGQSGAWIRISGFGVGSQKQRWNHGIDFGVISVRLPKSHVLQWPTSNHGG